MKASKRIQPGDPSVTKLSDFLCFTIYSANLALNKAYKPLLEELGLTYPQYIAIIALWEEDEQTISGLAEKLFLESNTVTPLLQKLEAMGYVRRRRDARDERLVRVGLTEAGHRLRQSALGKNVIEQTRLAPEDVPRIQREIAQIRDNLLDAAKGVDKAA